MNGNFQGNGVLSLNDGSYYEGEFSRDNPHGFGIFYYVNGDIYSGQFENGAYGGCGTYYYANGDRYEGDYMGNVSHGTGTFLEADGGASKYHYDHGTIIGEGTQVANASFPVSRNLPVENTTVASPVSPATPKEEIATKETGTSSTPLVEETKTKETPVKETIVEKPITQEAIAMTTKPSSVTNTSGTICPVCRGKGKITQAEIRKNKMVTKDISNGLGPRNFVTYSVNEVVRPAGNVSCGRCGGSGKLHEE